MFYRKKPVVIEAVQVPSEWPNAPMNVQSDIYAFLHGCSGFDILPVGVLIETLEGEMLASPGDWIIKGVKGEYYPCKPDIFAMTYEKSE